MYHSKKNKTNLQIYQENIRDFKGYIKNVVYKSKEYQNIMTRKTLYSLRGFNSHPLYFDIMIKEGEYFYIGDNLEKIPLSISANHVIL